MLPRSERRERFLNSHLVPQRVGDCRSQDHQAEIEHGQSEIPRNQHEEPTQTPHDWVRQSHPPEKLVHFRSLVDENHTGDSQENPTDDWFPSEEQCNPNHSDNRCEGVVFHFAASVVESDGRNQQEEKSEEELAPEQEEDSQCHQHHANQVFHFDSLVVVEQGRHQAAEGCDCGDGSEWPNPNQSKTDCTCENQC